MGNALAILGFTTLIGLVNGTNFLVIFIAMVIVFFLLGMIIGFHINSKKNNTKDDMSADKTDTSGKSRAINTLGPDDWNNAINQINNSYRGYSHSQHQQHKHSSSSHNSSHKDNTIR